MIKRIFAYALSIIVLGAFMVVPSFAGFAAGVSVDGYDLVRADPANDLYEATPGNSTSHIVTVQDFFAASPVYEYMNGRDSDIIRLGVAIYTYDTQSFDAPDVFGCFLLGSVLNSRFPTGNGPYSSFVDVAYYPVAISRTHNAQFGRIWSSYGTFYNANSKNLYGTNSYLCAYSYPSDDDPYFWFNVIQPNNRYERDFISDTEWFYSSSSLYDSWDKLMTALDRAENGGGSSDTLLSRTTSVPAGNALVIGFTNDLDVSCTAKFNTFSRRGSRSTTMQYYTTQYKLDDLHLTTSSTSVGSHSIPFQTAPPYTTSDTSYYVSWDYSYHSHTGTQYLYIVNPLYYQSYMATSSGSVAVNDINPSLSVTLSGRIVSVDLYILSASTASNSGQVSSTSVGSSENSVSGSIDSSSSDGVISWTDSDGNTFVPKTGGMNDVSDGGDDDLFSTLSHFFDNITSIFTWGHNAIISIYNSSSGFIQTLGSLYSWLPTEVMTVLTSAIILVVVIGLVKVFL